MSARTPAGVLFWIVAVVSVLWNSIGIADYTMTHLKVEAWMAAYTEEQRAYFDGFPSWYVGTWAIAVWTAFLGSILLLIRSKLALPVFVISFVTMLVSMVYFHFINPMPGSPAWAPLFGGLIFIIAAFLAWFARKQVKRGVLA